MVTLLALCLDHSEPEAAPCSGSSIRAMDTSFEDQGLDVPNVQNQFLAHLDGKSGVAVVTLEEPRRLVGLLETPPSHP